MSCQIRPTKHNNVILFKKYEHNYKNEALTLNEPIILNIFLITVVSQIPLTSLSSGTSFIKIKLGPLIHS